MTDISLESFQSQLGMLLRNLPPGTIAEQLRLRSAHQNQVRRSMQANRQIGYVTQIEILMLICCFGTGQSQSIVCRKRAAVR